MASAPIPSWQIDGETVETVSDFILGGSKITADGDCSHEIKRHLLLGRKVVTNLDRILKSRDITLSTKVCLVKAKVFPVVMYGCESWTIGKGWVPKSWCFWTVVMEKTLESPLDCKEIQPVHPKGDQSWVFIGRTDTEAETPILWPPHVKSWLIGKDPDAGRDWGQEEKGTTEDEMFGWHHQLDELSLCELRELVMDSGCLACCSSWGRKELDTTEWMTWTELNLYDSTPQKGFPDSSAGKESASNEGYLGLIPGLGRSPRKGKATHSSILAWRILWTVQGVTESQTWLSEQKNTFSVS